MDSFVEQLRFVTLPELFRANELSAPVIVKLLRWTGSFEEIESQTRQALGRRLTASPQELAEVFKRVGASYIFHLGISLGEWSVTAADAVRHWPEWWRKLDLNGLTAPSIILVTVVYPGGTLHRLRHFFALRSFRADISRIADSAPFAEDLHLLPELGSIGFADVEQWIRRYVHHADREALRRRLRPAFSRRLFGPRTRPMWHTAGLVRSALSDPSVRIVDT